MKKPLRIAVTGAAGQIGYALLFRLAAGGLAGGGRPVILQLLEVTPALPALRGVVMELQDCAFPGLHSIVVSDKPEVAFQDVDYAFLVGAKPRGPGMERADLLAGNAAIFAAQGKALNECAGRDARVLVIGNPANTNALITAKNAPDLDPRQITAMTRLDHNRAVAQLAAKTDAAVADIRQVTIWGNHSASQYPDLHHALVAGKPALELVDHGWYEKEYIPRVAKRGAEIIDARGASSAASAASAAIDAMRDWAQGTAADDWTSMAVPGDGAYGIGADLIYSLPTRCMGGRYEIVPGLEIGKFSRARMDATRTELEQERDAIRHLLD